jgi:hypothetical protein
MNVTSEEKGLFVYESIEIKYGTREGNSARLRYVIHHEIKFLRDMKPVDYLIWIAHTPNALPEISNITNIVNENLIELEFPKPYKSVST